MKNKELPQLGTKEFNDLASACFGGKPKQETLEEVSEYDVMPNIVYGENVGERIKIKAKIITKEEPKQETIEEAVQKVANSDDFINGALFGSQWQQERMYSEEEVYDILIHHTVELFKKEPITLEDFWNKFKKK